MVCSYCRSLVTLKKIKGLYKLNNVYRQEYWDVLNSQASNINKYSNSFTLIVQASNRLYVTKKVQIIQKVVFLTLQTIIRNIRYVLATIIFNYNLNTHKVIFQR